jgi:hypothetical protein
MYSATIPDTADEMMDVLLIQLIGDLDDALGSMSLITESVISMGSRCTVTLAVRHSHLANRNERVPIMKKNMVSKIFSSLVKSLSVKIPNRASAVRKQKIKDMIERSLLIKLIFEPLCLLSIHNQTAMIQPLPEHEALTDSLELIASLVTEAS